MESGARQDTILGCVVAALGALLILSVKPLSLANTFGAVLFAVGAVPGVANGLAWRRGDNPSIPVFRDEEMRKPRGRLGAFLGPLSFAVLVAVMWLAS